MPDGIRQDTKTSRICPSFARVACASGRSNANIIIPSYTFPHCLAVLAAAKHAGGLTVSVAHKPGASP